MVAAMRRYGEEMAGARGQGGRFRRWRDGGGRVGEGGGRAGVEVRVEVRAAAGRGRRGGHGGAAWRFGRRAGDGGGRCGRAWGCGGRVAGVVGRWRRWRWRLMVSGGEGRTCRV